MFSLSVHRVRVGVGGFDGLPLFSFAAAVENTRLREWRPLGGAFLEGLPVVSAQGLTGDEAGEARRQDAAGVVALL